MAVNTNAVGKSYPPRTYAVGREKIREYAYATGETNALHLDVALIHMHRGDRRGEGKRARERTCRFEPSAHGQRTRAHGGDSVCRGHRDFRSRD